MWRSVAVVRGAVGDDDELVALALARARARAGLPVDPDAIGGGGGHRAAVRLATSLGAPMAPVLDAIDEVARADRALAAEVRRAGAEGRAVAVGLVVGPPLLGMLTAGLVTEDPTAVLATGPGRALLLVAAVLWCCGALVVAATVRRASRPPVPRDDVLVIAATAVRAGEPLPTALRHAAEWSGGIDPASGGRSQGRPSRGDPARLALWLDLGAAGPPPPGWDDLGPALAEGVRSGVAVAPLLDEVARRARDRARAVALERAARLGARLAVPTALLLLPAALLLAAGPLVLAALTELR